MEEIRTAVGGPLTLAGIAERLNAAGYRTARGEAFRSGTVARIIGPGS